MPRHSADLRGRRADALLALSVSFTAHVLVSLAVSTIALDHDGAGEQQAMAAQRIAPSTDGEIDVDLAHGGARRARAVRASARGGEAVPRPDEGRAGRAGDGLVLAPAVNLAPRDDRGHLSPALRSRLERAQQARTKTGRERRSPEDDRVSLDSMLLTFVADGHGAALDPRPWRRVQTERSVGIEGARTTRLARDDDAFGLQPMRRGDEGDGAVHVAAVIDSASRSAHARPMTVPGPESSPSNERGAQQDDVNAEQEVMALEPSWLRASTAGGEPGPGVGGEPGAGRAAASGGARGPGSRARPLGSGGGGGFGIDPADRRRRNYLRSMWGKIDRAWSAADFPMQAALEGKQGYTIIGFVVAGDGQVSQLRVERPSGFPEFDARMVAAVQRAAPFGPLPSELRPQLRHRHEFVVSNPAVRPQR